MKQFGCEMRQNWLKNHFSDLLILFLSSAKRGTSKKKDWQNETYSQHNLLRRLVRNKGNFIGVRKVLVCKKSNDLDGLPLLTDASSVRFPRFIPNAPTLGGNLAKI